MRKYGYVRVSAKDQNPEAKQRTQKMIKIAKRNKKRYDNIVARVRLKSEIQQRESGNDCL